MTLPYMNLRSENVTFHLTSILLRVKIFLVNFTRNQILGFILDRNFHNKPIININFHSITPHTFKLDGNKYIYN